MTKLYIFVLPELIFHTFPITFFVASILTLFKLSSDNEIVVLFSFGIHPKKLLQTLFTPALLLTLLLFLNFLLIYPYAKILSKNFVYYKKSEAKFNLSASEFGHKFGKWLLYIGKNDSDGTYNDIFLFNKNNKEEILISAQNAEVLNDEGLLRLKLTNGEGYSYSLDSFSQINFKTMYINDTIKTKVIEYESAYGYWTSKRKKSLKKKMLITNTLISLFPLLSLFFVASISIVHARDQKAKIYLYLFLGIAVYYGLAFGLHKPLGFYTIPLVIVLWTSATYALYRKTIVARF